MIAQQTIVAGIIVLKIIGSIIFGLNNDFTVRKVSEDAVDVYAVTATKFDNVPDIRTFVLLRNNEGHFERMIILDSKKREIYNVPVNQVTYLRYHVRGDNVHGYHEVHNITAS